MRCLNSDIISGDCMLDYEKCKGKNCDNYLTAPKNGSIWLRLLISFVGFCKQTSKSDNWDGWRFFSVIFGGVFIMFGVILPLTVPKPSIILTLIPLGLFLFVFFIPIGVWICSVIKDAAVAKYNEAEENHKEGV